MATQRVSALKIVLVCTLFCLVRGASAVVEPDQTDRVKALMGHFAEARAKIKSLSFRCAIDGEDHSQVPPLRGQSKFEVQQKGEWIVGTSADVVSNLTTGEQLAAYTRRAVLNGDYAGTSYNGINGHLFMRRDKERHLELEQRSQVDSLRGVDLVRRAFGERINLIEEFKVFDMTAFRWAVEETKTADGESRLHLRGRAVKGDALAFDWVIDPTRGFTVCELTNYAEGKVWQRIVVESKEVGEGVWLPARVEILDYLATDDAAQLRAVGLSKADEPLCRKVLTYTAVRLNPDLEDSAFTISSLNLQEGSEMTRVDEDGRKQTMYFAGGAVVTREGAKAIREAQRRNDPKRDSRPPPEPRGGL